MRVFEWLWPLVVVAVSTAAGSARARPPKERALYERLGVDYTATTEQIKKAYRKQSMRYHPDKSSEEGAEEKFKNIAEAYNILSDKKQRDMYDRHGMDGVKAGAEEAHGFDASDLFSSFFGGGSMFQEGPKQAAATTIPLYVSLEQLYFGEYIDVEYDRRILCMHSDDCMRDDSDCVGVGKKVITQRVGPGYIMQNQVPDDSCVGKGKAWNRHCSDCPDGMYSMETANMTAHVEKGAKMGETIVFEGMGQQAVGYEAGDVIFSIKEMLHPRFAREGNDLKVTLEITLEEALLGFNVDFLHINGKKIKVSKTDISREEEIIIKKGFGMPLKKDPALFGTLYLKIKIKYPKKLPPQNRELVKQALANVTY